MASTLVIPGWEKLRPKPNKRRLALVGADLPHHQRCGSPPRCSSSRSSSSSCGAPGSAGWAATRCRSSWRWTRWSASRRPSRRTPSTAGSGAGSSSSSRRCCSAACSATGSAPTARSTSSSAGSSTSGRNKHNIDAQPLPAGLTRSSTSILVVFLVMAALRVAADRPARSDLPPGPHLHHRRRAGLGPGARELAARSARGWGSIRSWLGSSSSAPGRPSSASSAGPGSSAC